MPSLEKLLFVLNHLFVTDVEKHLKESGYALESIKNGHWLFTKKITSDRADVISLEQADTSFNSISHICSEDKNFSGFFDDATSKFGFEVLEDDKIAILLGTKEFDLLLIHHDYPPFQSFSAKLIKNTNRRRERVIEVILNPPPKS